MPTFQDMRKKNARGKKQLKEKNPKGETEMMNEIQ